MPDDPDPRAHDSPAVRRLFECYAAQLRRYARRLTRSREAAEDVVQDVFARLWLGGARLGHVGNVRAYLYRATRARALDHLARERSEARRREAPQVRALWEGSQDERDDDAEASAVVRAVGRVVEAMPPRQREVALLRFRAELSTYEIAKRLGISPRTVEVHLARIGRELRERVPGMLGGDEG